MPAPIDLSQAPIRPSRPSGKGGKATRGTGFPIDEYARKILWVALIVSILLLGFLLAGLFTGAWARDAMRTLYKFHIADYQRQMANIALISRALQLTTLIFIVCLLIIACRDESLGYILLATGLIFYAGLPFLTGQIYDMRGFKTSLATQELVRDFQMLAWIFFAPGLIWAVGDLVNRFRSAADAAAIQRVNAKYGANVTRQPKTSAVRSVLSRCWELPYCRNNIREKCPVYLKRQGPCWWYKEGCMCEERIILQAVINTDWKQKAARADMAYNFGQNRAGLTPAAKRERCRNCVIYNEHQRQKYKAMVTVALILVPVVLYSRWVALQSIAMGLLNSTEALMRRFSLGESPANIAMFHNQQSAVLEWTLIGAVCVVILTQVLKLIEFWCFKLKL